MIILTNKHFRQILAHALDSLPLEACGLLGGTIEDKIKIVKKVYSLTNMDQSPEHFTLDPSEQFDVMKDARKNGLIVLGSFHSHPSTPARPSAEDIRLAYDPEASYLILSLRDQENPVLKSFRIREGDVTEEPITISDAKDELIQKN